MLVQFDENKRYLYYASNDGHIYRQLRRDASAGNEIYTQLKEYEILFKGMKFVSITHKHMSVQKIIADCFLNKPEKDMCLIHIDGDISNNVPTNLKWVERDGVKARQHKNKTFVMIDSDMRIAFKSINQMADYLIANKYTTDVKLVVRHKVSNAIQSRETLYGLRFEVEE